MDFLREFSIGINFVEVTLLLAIALYLFYNDWKYKLRATELTALGFLLIAFTRISYIIYDYYIIENIYLYLAWGFLGTGNVLIIISLFKGVSRSIFYEFPHKELYFLGLGIYMVFMLTVVRSLNNTIFYIMCVGIGILMLVPLILRLDKLLDKTGGYIKRYFSLAIIGLPLSFLAIGIGPLWRDLPVVQGWLLKIGMHVLFLASMMVLAVALFKLPSLNEFGWEQSLKHLYIILPNGAVIYSFNFKEVRSMDPERLIDPQLLGSGLTGIVAMVQEMTKSRKRLVFIKQERKNLYVDYGKNVTVALLGEEQLKVVFEKLDRFVYEFERIFQDISHWEYSTEEFKISGMLVRSIFAI